MGVERQQQETVVSLKLPREKSIKCMKRTYSEYSIGVGVARKVKEAGERGRMEVAIV